MPEQSQELPVPRVALREAMLCANCDSIWPASGSQECPACGSRQGFPLARLVEPLEGRR